MKYKYYWWLAPNGMIGKYRKSPGDGWRGPYDSVRDLKAAQQRVQPTPESGRVLPVESIESKGSAPAESG